MTTITNKLLRECFVTVGLERELGADKDGVLRDKTMRALSECADRMQTQRQAGLSPSDYVKSEKMLAALRVAEQVINRTWNGFHAS